jgi:DNA (cytosine-5)-methyltransferase 1
VRFLSVCSGIEAASVAWQPLGWKAVAFSEIEPFPCALLKHHYPDTPNLGDMTKYKDWPDDLSIDLLCGGTPCQSFSVAGLRKGLDDPRGNLMLTFGAIAAKYRPKWLVWENVPGVLSSNGGRDFGAFLGMLGQLGYGFAYRVLDAQYFGVAQRRRRVFVVGCLGDWRSAAAVLFERHSLQGHPAPRRQAGQAVTGTLSARTEGGGGLGTDFDCSGGVQPVARTLCVATGQAGAEIGADMAPTLNCNHETPYVASYAIQAGALRTNPLSGPDGVGVQASIAYTLEARAEVQAIAFGGQMSVVQTDVDMTQTLQAKNPQAVAVSLRGRDGGATAELGDEVGNCLRASGGGGDKAHVLASMQVRRLTPEECEALQGFPRSYTAVPNRGKPAADGPRYKALGNSWAVPNVRWIGERINEVLKTNNLKEAA